jgi:peptide/nickel transport system permease protein
MASYIVRRLLYMIPISLVLSFICFMVVEMAPGDFVSIFAAKMSSSTGSGGLSQQDVQQQLNFVSTLRKQYGLDKPLLQRYVFWITRIVTKGDFGYNLSYGRNVTDMIKERLPWTLAISVTTLILTFALGLILGVYSATHQYSLVDYLVSGLSFFGMSVPSFFTALLFMIIVVLVFHGSAGGIFSSKYAAAPWSLAKVWDLVQHLSLPILVSVIHSTAGTLRIARGQLLDILNMPYVQTARAKGLKERTVVYKHALRNALHPLIMGLGASLPGILAGETILSIVMGLPTVGRMFYDAIITQDSYTAGAGLLITAVLLQVGNLLADVALVAVDPTISYD